MPTKIALNQMKLIKISDILCDNIEHVFETLQLDMGKSNKYYYMPCPLHGSKKRDSLLIYPDGHTHRGWWCCNTQHCDRYFKPTIIGFIRGVLSSQRLGWRSNKDKFVSFEDTLKFISEEFKINFDKIEVDHEYLEKKKFLAQTNWSIPMAKDKPLIHRNEVKARLGKPPKYFINRGFTKEILEKYDVGFCDDPKKPMYQRCVVPVYDPGYNYLVGCQGRSIYESCQKCGGYHDPFSAKCIEFPKWKNSLNFNKKDHLYNYWFAREHIKRSKTVVLVESCGNVWRLEEAGVRNSVALFGGEFHDAQQFMIDQLGVMNIVIIMDNDENGAGLAHEKRIIEQTKNFYNVRAIHIDPGDVADMSVEKIRENIVPNL
jgi:hypothetical protein